MQWVVMVVTFVQLILHYIDLKKEESIFAEYKNIKKGKMRCMKVETRINVTLFIYHVTNYVYIYHKYHLIITPN